MRGRGTDGVEEHCVCHPWLEVVDVVAATVVGPGVGETA